MISNTVWNAALIGVVEEAIEAGCGPALVRGVADIRAGRVPRWWQDFVFQNHFSNDVGYEEAWALAVMNMVLDSGCLAKIVVPTPSPPAANARIGENNRLLADLPTPFYGEFDGGVEEYDGIIGWSEPVMAYWSSAVDPTDHWETIAPGEVGLEVGTMSAAKCYPLIFGRALGHEGRTVHHGLARWPYGHREITVMVCRVWRPWHLSGESPPWMDPTFLAALDALGAAPRRRHRDQIN